MIVPQQIRATRGLLGLSQTELSKLAGVAVSTVKRIEVAVEVTGSGRTLWQIQDALEKAGVEFIRAEGKSGPGVRLKDNVAPKPRKRRATPT